MASTLTRSSMDGFRIETGRVDAKPVKEALASITGKKRHEWKARETINYGWDFVSLEVGEWKWNKIPEPIARIRQAVFAVFSKRLMEGKQAKDFNNIIITVYGPGQRIDPHIDRDKNPRPEFKRNFFFGKSVLGVILKADAKGRLFFLRGDGQKVPPFEGDRVAELAEEAGLCFLMQGALRHAPFYHAVSTIAEQRISITFRTTHKIGNLTSRL